MNINTVYLQLADKYDLNEIKKLEHMKKSILVVGEGAVPLRCVGKLLNLPQLGRMYVDTVYDICMEYDETDSELDYEGVQDRLGEDSGVSGTVCRLQIRCSHAELKDRRIRIISLTEAYDKMLWKEILLEADICCFCLSAIHPLAMAERQFVREYLSDCLYHTVYLLEDMDKVEKENQQKVLGLLEQFLPEQRILNLQSQEAEEWDRMFGNLQESRAVRIREYIKEKLNDYREQILQDDLKLIGRDSEEVKKAFDEIQDAVMNYCKTFPLENLRTQLTGQLISFNSGLQKDLASGIEEESDVRELKRAVPGYLFSEWEEFLQGAFSGAVTQGFADLAAACKECMEREVRKKLPEVWYPHISNLETLCETIDKEIKESVKCCALSYTGAQIRKYGKLSKQELLKEGKKISARALTDATERMEELVQEAQGVLESQLKFIYGALMTQMEAEIQRGKEEREKNEEKIRILEQDLEVLR